MEVYYPGVRSTPCSVKHKPLGGSGSMPPRKVLKRDYSEIESETTFSYLSLHFMHRELIVFISNTCTKFVLLHTYFTNKTINQCIVQPVCRLTWAKCFIAGGVLSQHRLNYNYPTSYC